MSSKLVLLIGFLSTFGTLRSQETSIECPFPEGTDNMSLERCGDFPACQYTNGKCHMMDTPEASYAVDPGSNESLIFLSKVNSSYTLFGQDILQLAVEITEHEAYHLQIKIYDPNSERYEVPIPLNLPETPDDESLYEVNWSDYPFNLQIQRMDQSEVILSTVGPLTYEDQFIQVTFALASSYMYGLGENTHLTLRHVFEPRTTFPIWNRPQGYTEEPVNLLSQHPVFMVIEDEKGTSHSVLFYNSNAMESSTFLLDDGTPALTLRTIGGIIDLHIFLGPTPNDLSMQYAKMVGYQVMLPYWYLGFHLSRYGYNGTDHVREVVQRNKNAGIPQDIQTCDINYMDNYRIFTYGEDTSEWGDLPLLADELHQDQLYLTLIFDPPLAIDWDSYLPASRGKANDVYIKWANDSLIPDDQYPMCEDYVVGYLWPNNKTVFPDFLLPQTRDWWASEIEIFHDLVDFDTIWLDMNDPANFGTDLDRPSNYPPELEDWSLKCPDNKWDSPPYPTMTVRIQDNLSDRISDNTLCMSAAHKDGEGNSYLHYDVHSIYANGEAEASYDGLLRVFPDRRPAVLSRSSFVGFGKLGLHWLGDNHSSWSHMRLSIIGLIEFNIFGMPIVGADICGHFNEPSAELCARWMQLGSFYTFSRNHNNENNRDQDPASWGPEIAAICRDALMIRYTHLPYLYTLMYKSSTEGTTMARALFFEFPDDIAARDIDDQFLWGSGFMVAPVVYENATARNVYFPEGLWYDLVSGELVAQGPSTLLVFAPLEKIPLFLRGGLILPGQTPAIRTAISRLNPMRLVVALDNARSSFGQLYWDDGESLNISPDMALLSNFTFSDDTLRYSLVQGSNAAESLIFDQVNVYGFWGDPSSVLINDEATPLEQWSYDSQLKVLHVSMSEPVGQDWELQIIV